MAMTWDRDDIIRFFQGDYGASKCVEDQDGWFTAPVTGARYYRYIGRGDTAEGLLLNLRDTGADLDRPAIITPLLAELNTQRDDDEGVEWGDGWLEVAQRGVEAIGMQNRQDGICPSEYFDEFCQALTERGWDGHLTLPPLVLSHLGGPLGAEPSITTVLGYGVREVRPSDGSPLRRKDYEPSWVDNPELVRHVAATAVGWLEAVPGVTVISGALEWEPTPDQARAHLADSLLAGVSPSLERLVVGERPAGGRAVRTGRVAYARQGSLVLIDHEPDRLLADRLADHRRVLTSQEHRVRYAFTTGTLGYTYYLPMIVYSQRESLHPHITFYGHANAVPHQLEGHSPGLTDVHYSQLFPIDWLPRAENLDVWRVTVRDHGLVEVTATDPTPWFEQWVDPRRPEDADRKIRHVHDADAATLRQAREDFGQLLQRPLSE